MSNVRLSVEEVHKIAFDCLTSNGCNEANATAVADTLTAAERDICVSHGLFRLPGYVASLRSGKVNGNAAPSVNLVGGSVLRVSGDGGFAPLALQTGHQALVDLAKSSGIAAMTLVDIYHFSALWVETEALANDGLCAMSFTSYLPNVVPAGGKDALFGTNPMAFGWPRINKPPVVFDQASAAQARGEIMIAARDGHTLPDGVGIDTDGNPTTDPAKVLEGAILPFGGYKGSNIAMMIELLAAALIGEQTSVEASANDNADGGPPLGGELIIAMDPAKFGDPAGWSNRAESLFSEMLSQDGVRLPAARRFMNRKKTAKSGVSVAASVIDKVSSLTVA